MRSIKPRLPGTHFASAACSPATTPIVSTELDANVAQQSFLSARAQAFVAYPTTPDRRYLVVRGRLWRTTNPDLDEATRQALVAALMTARRAIRAARGDPAAVANARHAVDAAKRGLGERGPVWWTDGAPDLNRRLAKNTPYAEWFKSSGGA